MTYFPVSSPYQLFADEAGNPLESGYIYIGQSNLNPITNPITVSWDNAGLYPAAQPVRTIGGYPDRNGSAGELFIDGVSYKNYSIIVQTRNQETVFYSRSENNTTADVFYVYSEADLLAAEADGICAVLGNDITLTSNYTPRIPIDTNGYEIDGVVTLDFSIHQPKALTDACFGSNVTVTGLAKVKMDYWTANAVPRTTSMTSALVKALACADASDSYVAVDAGEYLLDGVIDLTGISQVNMVGVYRKSIFRIDYGGTALFDLSNAGPSFYRGHKFMGLTFGLNSSGASIPDHVIYSDYTPEFLIFECMFINCSSVSQLRLSNTFVCHIAHGIFVGDENVATSYGDFPQSGSGGGTCIHLEAENHNSTIRNSRIRASDAGATSAGIKLAGGDGIKIADNAIESNRNRGISVEGSTSQLTIDNNYFEGGSQPIDIYYSSAGTNFGHTIFRNWFNAVQAVEVDGAQINDMRIINNTFDSQALAVNILGTASKNGLFIKDNLHRDQIGAQLPWNIAEFPTSLSSIVEPDIEIQDRFVGTGRIAANDLYPFSKTTLAQNNSWQTYTGSGTAANSTIYLGGLQGYDLTSVDSSYVGITCQGYNNSWRDKYITVFVFLATSDSRTQTVVLDFDAAISYTFSCATEATGRMIRIQRTVPSGATRFYVRFLVGPTLTTLVTLVPTVYFGLHSTPEFYEWR